MYLLRMYLLMCKARAEQRSQSFIEAVFMGLADFLPVLSLTLPQEAARLSQNYSLARIR